MLGKKIAFNTLIAAGTRVLGLTLSLITLGLIARYLGQEGFGYYTTILAFLYFFVVLSDLGLYSVCVRDISRFPAKEKEIASYTFTIRFFSGLLIFSLAPLIVHFFPYPSSVKLGVLIGAVGFWLFSNQQVLLGVFQKYLCLDKVALAELFGRLSQLGLVIFFIWQKADFLFIVGALVVGALINFVLVFFFSQKYIPISFKFDFSFWKNLLKQSLPLGLATLFTAIYFKIDTIMLSLIKGPIEVGIYGLAYKILESLLFFPAMFVGLIMPLISKYAFWDKVKFKEISQKTLDILLMFIFPMWGGIFLLSERITVLLAGKEFLISGDVLDILIIAAGIIFLGVLFSNILIALDQQKKLTYIYGFGALINLIANFIFIPRYSYYGAAATTVLTELLTAFLMGMVIRRVISLTFPLGKFVKYSGATLMMVLFLFLFQSLPLSLLIGLGAVIYFVFLWMSGGISRAEILNLVKQKE